MSDQDIRKQAIPAFRFVVEIDGENQAAFTEITLPTIEWETEEIKEGGLNTFTHVLPGRRKSARLTLKNGVGKSSILQWYMDSMSEQIKRKPITITLLDSEQNTVQVWELKDAYPVKWTGPQLKSDANTIAIQSIEFACGEVVVS